MTKETEITYNQGEKSIPVAVDKNNPNVRSQMITLEMNLSQFGERKTNKVCDALVNNLEDIEGVYGVTDMHGHLDHHTELRVTIKYIENDVRDTIKKVVKETKRVVNRITDREGLEKECIQYIERANKVNINE